MGVELGASQEDILAALWRDMSVDEVALSIASNGFFRHEFLFAIKHHSRFVVIEGNRRLAAVKLLRNAALRQSLKATDLPTVSASTLAALNTLPVVITTRKDIWQYLGFKHVNGPQAWGAYSKAEYVARVHNEYGVPLEEIAKHIGDKHATVRRFYRGLMVLAQAKDTGVFTRDDRWNRRFFFSHLYTGLGYPGFQTFLGLKDARSYKPNPVPKARLQELGLLCLWLYGSKSKGIQPLIASQNPDLKVLEETLQTERGQDALKASLPLHVAADAAKGDPRILRESIAAAKAALQRAVGTARTGFDGSVDVVELARDTHDISTQLVETLEQAGNQLPSRRSGSKSKRR